MSGSEFPLRRGFERVLGPTVMAYLLHLRPLEWPIMSAHFLLGTLMAWGFQIQEASHLGATFLGWFVFVALLNGGTLAINSAFDQDEGDIGYLRQPPKPPRYLLPFSAILLAAALGLGFLLPPVFAWSNALCVLMAVLYSVPPPRLKARAGWDLLINMVGFGLLTPLAGWGLTGRPVPAWFWAMVVGFALLFGALYPTTQIYQIEEDRARGDRTLVIRLGEGRSLGAAVLLALGAHACFAWAVQAHHAQPVPILAAILGEGHRIDWPGFVRQGGPSVAWLLLSLGAWLAILVPWCLRWHTLSPKRQEAGMYWALAAWAVTDLSLLILLWPC